MPSLLVVVPFALLTLLAAGQDPPACDSVESCRSLAHQAAARGEYETFHDFAWLAVRRGRPNDPELMYLLARAQSLSGRPHDALVMLRRLAAMGVASDADTNEEFRRVRSLSGWPDVGAMIVAARENAAPASPPVTPAAPAVEKSMGASERAPASAPEPPSAVRAPHPDPSRALRSAPAPAPLASAAAPEPLTIVRGGFAPVGLAYDAVSRRFIAGDRRANKLMVLDEEFRRINDLAAADSAGFFGLTAVGIDRRRGDLWVANAMGDGSATAVHRLQLISGRVLQVLPLPSDRGPARFGDIALTPGGTVLALDVHGGRIFPLRAGSYVSPIAIAGHELLSIAALDEHTACIATRQGLLRVDLPSGRVLPVREAADVALAGFVHIRAYRGSIVGVQRIGDASRIVRVRFAPGGGRAVSIDVIGEVALADPTAIAIDGSVLHYLGRDGDGTTTVRHISLVRRR